MSKKNNIKDVNEVNETVPCLPAKYFIYTFMCVCVFARKNKKSQINVINIRHMTSKYQQFSKLFFFSNKYYFLIHISISSHIKYKVIIRKYSSFSFVFERYFSDICVVFKKKKKVNDSHMYL